MTHKDQWTAGFGAAFRPYFDLMPEWQTEAWVRLAINYLHLGKGSSLLDCPCGFGRISVPLAKAGIEVTGVDIMPEYVAEFNKTAETEQLPLTAIVGDMRDLPFENQFDGAINLFTSFGYFTDEGDNQRVLSSVFTALKPGGRFILDTVNRDWLAKNYVSSNWENRGDLRLLQRRSFDFETSLETCDWTFMDTDGEETFTVPLRWYNLHELVAMFEAAGFVDILHFGDFDEQPVGFSTKRLFVVGTKPE